MRYWKQHLTILGQLLIGLALIVFVASTPSVPIISEDSSSESGRTTSARVGERVGEGSVGGVPVGDAENPGGFGGGGRSEDIFGTDGWINKSLLDGGKDQEIPPLKKSQERAGDGRANDLRQDYNFIYNVVDEMWRDQSVDIVFKLSPLSRPAPILNKIIAGQRKAGVLVASTFVSVKMRGVGGIQVTPVDDAKKQLATDSETSWQWEVTPKSTGQKLLHLVVYAHFGEDGVPYTLKAYEDTILVKVSHYQRVKDVAAEVAPVWVFVAGGTGIPALLAAFYWFRGNKKTPVEDPTEV